MQDKGKAETQVWHLPQPGDEDDMYGLVLGVREEIPTADRSKVGFDSKCILAVSEIPLFRTYEDAHAYIEEFEEQLATTESSVR